MPPWACRAIRLATGGGSGGDGGRKEEWTAWVLSQPWGRWIVIAIGLVTIGAGIYYGYKGVSERYKKRQMRTEWSERLSPVAKFGLVAHGVVIVIIGCFFVWAGWTNDPSEAGGMGQAFETVRTAMFGRVLLGVLALGMVAFAVYCLIEARYRIVPARAGDDMTTLADKAAGKVRRAGDEIAPRSPVTPLYLPVRAR